jgi:hypothetical protein
VLSGKSLDGETPVLETGGGGFNSRFPDSEIKMITKVTAENLKEFTLSEKHILILCDADWNKNKELATKFKQVADDFEKNPGVGEFAFGELDVNDNGLWDFLNEWKVTNVPSVLYIWNDIALTKPLISTRVGNHNIKEHCVNLLREEIMRNDFGMKEGLN